jgi:hypothetical protein
MRPFTLRQRRLILRPVSTAGSTLPTCIFEVIPKSSPGPFGSALPPPLWLFVALRGTFDVRNPLPSSISEFPGCPQVAAPLRDLSIPPDRSAQPDFNQRGLPLRVARFSFAPRYARNNHLSPAQRINVPDSLLPARLAVLRTSWNHPHDATSCFQGQAKKGVLSHFPSGNIHCRINYIQGKTGECLVDKTRNRNLVFTKLALRPFYLNRLRRRRRQVQDHPRICRSPQMIGVRAGQD